MRDEWRYQCSGCKQLFNWDDIIMMSNDEHGIYLLCDICLDKRCNIK